MDDTISVILQRLRLKAGIFTTANYCGTWAVDTSGRKAATFHLISAGDCWLHLPGEAPRRLNPGDLVFLPRDAHHLIASSDAIDVDVVVNEPPREDPDLPRARMLCGYFEFLSQANWPLLDALPDVVVLDLGRRTGGEASLLVDLMLAECDDERPGRSTVLDQLAYVLLVYVIRRALEGGGIEGLIPAMADPKIGAALNLIHGSPENNWTLEELAQRAGMSRTAFANRFRELVGEPAMSYLTNWRMQVAIDLLASTDFTMFAIAEATGYASEAAFRNAFTKQVGTPPGRFRREHGDPRSIHRAG